MFKKNPELLARGLEEGLCEFIGSLLTNSHFFDNSIVYNYVRYRRLKYGNKNQKFRIYTDYMRLAYRLYLYVGLGGIVDIINAGRKKIKETETLLLNRDINEISKYFSSNVDENINKLTNKLLLGTIENEVLSPFAFYIISKYNNENSISEFAHNNNLNIKDCSDAFNEIQDRIFGCVLDNDIIEFSDIAQIQRNSNIYYEC